MVTRGHKKSLNVTIGKKLKTSHRDQIFCMYTQISIRNHIMYENLFLEVIEGHESSQKVKNGLSKMPENLCHNHILVITTTKSISYVYKVIHIGLG